MSSEAPRFKTVEASGELTVVHPPAQPPTVSPLPRPGQRYRVGTAVCWARLYCVLQVGEILELNCSSPASTPPAKLRYFINNQMVGLNCILIRFYL